MYRFESLASPERSINRLETLGHLFGLNVKSVKNASVLELACGTGRNLIPQAFSYPKSNFVGIDIDGSLIEEANSAKNSLSISNINFVKASFRDYLKENNTFDYIICHGAYSWLSDLERREILEIISNCLANNGVAYVSFNCLPGWFERAKVQQFLVKEVKENLTEEEKVKEARLKIRELFDSSNNKDLKAEIEFCEGQSDAFFLQELLNKNVKPYHLKQFVSEINKKSLFYLCDAKPNRNRHFRLNEETQLNDNYKDKDFSKLDRLSLEQDMDELLPLSFRAALVTKKNLEKGDIEINNFKDCYLASPLLPKEEKPDLFKDYPELFIGPNESSAEISKPFFKAFFLSFRHAWPKFLSFFEVLKMAGDLTGTTIDEKELLEEIKKFYLFGLLEVTKEAPKFPSKPFCVMDYVSANIDNVSWVTTCKHEYFPIDAFDKSLIKLLDGSFKVNDAIEKLYLQISESSKAEDKKTVVGMIKKELEERLKAYIEQGLLVM